MGIARYARLLLKSAHAGPTTVVTGLSALLAYRSGLRGRRFATMVAAVLTGQLSIGWSNDLIDRGKDAAAGRTDKPLASGELSTRTALVALAAASTATTVLSARTGRRSGQVHGILVVGSGWLYNLWLKRTAASFVPYAIAFGSLPQVPSLGQAPPRLERASRSMAGALLGVGAHLVNALPDLAADNATGVRGLPQRLSPAALRAGAALCLSAAGWCAAKDAPAGAGKTGWALGSLVLGAGVLGGRGSVPFYSAAACAVLDAVAMVRAHPTDLLPAPSTATVST